MTFPNWAQLELMNFDDLQLFIMDAPKWNPKDDKYRPSVIVGMMFAFVAIAALILIHIFGR